MIQGVGGGSSYPTHTKTNYVDWVLLMKVKLRVRSLWPIVEKGDGDVQEDMRALDALSSAMPPELVSMVASRDSAKQAWEAIRIMRVSDDHVRASMTQQLLWQFENATLEEESIEDFSMRLSGMVQHLATLGETVAKPKVVGKFLRSVPHRYRQIVVAIQILLDVDKLTLVNVTGRLKAAEYELEAPPPMVGVKARSTWRWVPSIKSGDRFISMRRESSSCLGRRRSALPRSGSATPGL
jgi:hypothetical protein